MEVPFSIGTPHTDKKSARKDRRRYGRQDSRLVGSVRWYLFAFPLKSCDVDLVEALILPPTSSSSSISISQLRFADKGQLPSAAVLRCARDATLRRVALSTSPHFLHHQCLRVCCSCEPSRRAFLCLSGMLFNCARCPKEDSSPSSNSPSHDPRLTSTTPGSNNSSPEKSESQKGSSNVFMHFLLRAFRQDEYLQRRSEKHMSKKRRQQELVIPKVIVQSASGYVEELGFDEKGAKTINRYKRKNSKEDSLKPPPSSSCANASASTSSPSSTPESSRKKPSFSISVDSDAEEHP
ncbi:unnamed protein product [Cyprideis torosa]|uniref:Uncharacterized protein n=1 Tax=Cyprideis torosa TaxID=163714 RepID=A0A7R8WNC0_9CRUS|nr:unnamed protein product [Cyprideis torosa]CAG0903851.1 unnamed protein product [Cyprideis torosa]